MADSRVERVRGLLDGLTEAEVRAFGIQAIRNHRAWVRQQGRPPDHVFQMHGSFGREFALALAKHKGVSITGTDADTLKEVFSGGVVDALHEPWMIGVLGFLSWLSNSGLAFLRSQGIGEIRIMLTPRGIAFFDRDEVEDDPLLPGFLERIKDRCPGLPDGVIALLVDTRACLDRSLGRPAVVLMGLAYETVIEQVVDALATTGHVEEKTRRAEAADRIKRIKGLLRDEARFKDLVPERDDRRHVELAYDFADNLRLRRNEGAHTTPAFDFDHPAENHEFLVSAGRNLPGLWLLGVRAREANARTGP